MSGTDKEHKDNRCSLLLLVLFLFSAGCQSTGPAALNTLVAPAEADVRFLLTFDDGPTGAASSSSTALVLDQLKRNLIQPDVKAIFFLQTREPHHGGSEEGQRLMQREHAEGHVLALHSGSVRGHLNHTKMKAEELQQSLLDGIGDISRITGNAPLFVRPTFWRYNADTLARYENNSLNMLLSDVKAYDGGSGLLHFSSMFGTQRHGSMLSELQRVKRKIDGHEIPAVNDVIPIIVTFHDTNAFTVRHLEEYMRILVEEAKRAGIALSSKPFYDDAGEIQTAAINRAEHKVILETRLPARISRFFKRS